MFHLSGLQWQSKCREVTDWFIFNNADVKSDYTASNGMLGSG